MGKAPAFQFYASDFDMDTKAWTISETGIYIRLLMYQWVNVELPRETSRLARIAGCDSRTLQKCWNQTVAKKFITNESGMLQNYKLEEIREERMNFIEKAEKSGRLGGLKAQENKRINQSDPLSTPSSESEALHLLSSSSSSKDIKAKAKDFVLPSKEEIKDYSKTKIKDSIDIVCYRIYHEDIFKKVYAFKGMHIKKNKNERAILHTLLALYKKKPIPDNQWKFCQKIMSLEDQNYNERDNTQNTQ